MKNHVLVWVVVVFAAVVVAGLRIYQVLFQTDPQTGFYTDGGLSSILIWGILAAAVLFTILMCLFGKNTTMQYRAQKSIFSAVLLGIAGIGLVVQGIASFAGFQPALFVGPQIEWMCMVSGIADILAGITFVVCAAGYQQGIFVLRVHPLLALLPSLWGCVTLVSFFITYTEVVSVNENLYDIFTIIAVLLFLFFQTKLYVGIDSRKNRFYLRICGICSFLFAVGISLPNLLLYFGFQTESSFLPPFTSLVYLILSVSFLPFLVRMQVPSGRMADERAEM